MYEIRGKYLWIEAHAYEGMNAERPPIKLEYLYEAVDDPDRTVTEGKTRVKAMNGSGNVPS